MIAKPQAELCEPKIYRAEDGGVIKVSYEVHPPQDAQAATRWLRNRQPRGLFETVILAFWR